MTNVIILGDSGSGKTSLIRRKLYNDIVTSHIPTIGIDYSTFRTNDSILYFLDTAGNEVFDKFISAYYNKAQIAIFVYDVSNIDSYNNSSPCMIRQA